MLARPPGCRPSATPRPKTDSHNLIYFLSVSTIVYLVEVQNKNYNGCFWHLMVSKSFYNQGCNCDYSNVVPTVTTELSHEYVYNIAQRRTLFDFRQG